MDYKKQISDCLKKLGVPANTYGYFYLRYAIELTIEELSSDNGGIPCSMTKKIYPTVAKHFNSTWSRVERAMRTAIENVLVYGDLDFIEEVFGNSIRQDKGKPVNAAFVATVADYVIMTTT